MIMPLWNLFSQIPTLGWSMILFGAACCFFMILIFAEDKKKGSNKALLLLSAIILCWGLMYWVWVVSSGDIIRERILILFYSITALIPPATLLLTYLFAYQEEALAEIPKKAAAVLLPYITLVILMLAFPGFIVGYNAQAIHAPLVFGGGFALFALYALVCLSLGFYLLYKKYARSAGIFIAELRYLLAIFIVAGGFGLWFAIFLPLFSHNLDLFWVGHLGVVTFLFLSGLFTIRYNFWSFKVIATEFFVSFILVILLVELFLATSLLDLFMRTSIAFLILCAGFFLINSIKREFDSQNRIRHLLHDLDEVNARLKILDRKKSEFLLTASHHLRDPLTSIKGYASMIAEGSFGPVDAPMKEALTKIFDSSKQLVTVISDFLDISSIESGDIKYEFARVDMGDLVSGLALDMQLYAKNAGITLESAIDTPAGGLWVRGDYGKLRQVCSNLIDNAIKYTPQGTVTVGLAKSDDGKDVVFSVTDTGIGMSAETRKKLFKKFSRAQGVSKVYTEGTGLGLYVAKEIIKKHKGKIWAESSGEGKGSSFLVSLPIQTQTADADPA